MKIFRYELVSLKFPIRVQEIRNYTTEPIKYQFFKLFFYKLFLLQAGFVFLSILLSVNPTADIFIKKKKTEIIEKKTLFP